ncbi:Subtilisin NAT, partial [Tetrabaena socialis]
MLGPPGAWVGQAAVVGTVDGSGLVLLLVLGFCAAAIVLPVCLTVGCTPKPDEQEGDPISLRLMVRLAEADATVKKLLPLLSGLFNSSKLASSGLELLDFEDLDIMREVKSRLREQHAGILDLMLDDFLVTSWPQLDPLSETIPTNAHAHATAAAAAAAAATAGFSTSDVATAAAAATGAAGRRSAQAVNSSQQQLGAADPLEAQQWHLDITRAASAWAITRGGPSGRYRGGDRHWVDLDHPDIRPNLWINLGEIPDNGIDNGGNGERPRAHVSDNSGNFWTSNIMPAYDYALRMGAHIVSCSLGPRSPILQPEADAGAPSGLVLLLVLGFCAAAIVLPVCLTVGCTPKPDEQEGDPISLRLMVRLAEADATVKKLLPLLSGLFNSSKLASSGLELLDFEDLDIMREVKSRLREQHAGRRQALIDPATTASSTTATTTANASDLTAERRAAQATAGLASPASQGSTSAAIGTASASAPVTGSVPVSGVVLSPDQLYRPGRCGSDPDPRPAPSDTGHGTHVAGLVGAVRGNGLGGTGVAPNVKIMVLKVSDNSGNFWTSNIMSAYDYALRMGAHVVSCSFGPRSPILQPTSSDRAQAAQELRLYERAVQPMAQKGVLLVAAAGNEDTDLDQVRNVNMPYLPCTLDLPNVVCVAASNSNNQIWREIASNRWIGTNTGRTTVDIAAPGSRIISTVPGGGATGAYGDKTGSSMATPIVSGAAALVLSVLGASDGNFYQAARARSLLLETGDSRPDLPVISGRTLNAGRAVQAATALAGTGATLLVPMVVDVAAQSSVLLRGLTDSYFRVPPATAAAIAAAASSDATATGTATTNGSVAAVSPMAAGPSSLLGLLPFGGSVRSASTRLSSFKYVGEDVMVAVCGHLKLPEAGQYGVRLATTSPLARLAVTVGQRQLVWQAGGVREAVLQVPQPGWYNFELLYANSVQSLELSWALPSSPRTFGSLPDGYLGTGSMARSTAPAHAPASLPVPGAVPSGFQVLWQPVASAPATFPGSDAEEAGVVDGPTTGSWDGGLLVTLDAERFYPYSSIVEDVSYTSSGALAGAMAGGGGGTSAVAAGGAVYGLALAHIRALTASPQLQFRVTCSFCSLYVGDMLVLEVLDPANPAAGPLATRLSSCLTLGPTASTPAPAPPLPSAAGARRTTATYPLQLRFATPNASVAALVLQWAPCNSSLATFAPLAPLLAGGLWYREPAAPPPPAAAAGGGIATTVPAAASTPPPPSMQCDAWNSSAVAIPLPGTVVVLPRPEEVAPAYSFRLPSPNASFLPCPGPIGTFCPSGANLTFRIADLYPALLRSAEPLYVRCWAWWSSSFRGGLLTVRSSGTLNTAVYVAGQRNLLVLLPNYRRAVYQVFYSVANNPQLIANRQPSAPNTTSLAGGYRQLLALEWHGVAPTARLSVMDGSMDGMLMNATLLVANMFAPAA